jgi:hypothetical protein
VTSVTLDPIGVECVQGSEARILECAGMTALWNDATCRVGESGDMSPQSKRERMRMGFSDTNWVKLGSFSYFEKVAIGEIVNV